MKKTLISIIGILSVAFAVASATETNTALVKDKVTSICPQLVHFSNSGNTYAGISGVSATDTYARAIATFSSNGVIVVSNSWFGSVAFKIVAADSNNWTMAFNWGDHATAGYLKVATDLVARALGEYGSNTALTVSNSWFGSTAYQITSLDTSAWYQAYNWLMSNSASLVDTNYLTNALYIAMTPVRNSSNNWNLAYSWGNHSTNGYLKADMNQAGVSNLNNLSISYSVAHPSVATGPGSFAMGYDCFAYGYGAFSAGVQNYVTGNGSFAIGVQNNVTYSNALYAGAIGSENTASAKDSLAFGNGCFSTNQSAITAGYRAKSAGRYSFTWSGGYAAGSGIAYTGYGDRSFTAYAEGGHYHDGGPIMNNNTNLTEAAAYGSNSVVILNQQTNSYMKLGLWQSSSNLVFDSATNSFNLPTVTNQISCFWGGVYNTCTNIFSKSMTLSWYANADYKGTNLYWLANMSLVASPLTASEVIGSYTCVVADATGFLTNDLVYFQTTATKARIKEINGNILTFTDSLIANHTAPEGVSRIAEFGGFGMWNNAGISSIYGRMIATNAISCTNKIEMLYKE